MFITTAKNQDGTSEFGRFEQGKWIPMTMFREPEITLQTLAGRLGRVEHILGSSLHYHADIHFRSATEVIIAGELNGKDFVGRYLIGADRVPELTRYLHDLSCVIQRGRVDVPFPLPQEMF